MPTIDTIPSKAGEVCRALITAAVPSGKWYSRHGGETIGAISADSDLAIRSGDLILSRIWHAGDTVFRLNRSGAGSLAAWVWGAGNVRGNGEFRPGDATDAPLGEGHAKSIYLAFGADVEVELLLLSLIASSGTGWYNCALTADQNALLDTLGGDFEVNFVIADTAGAPPEPAIRDTAGAVAAGAPGLTAGAEAVPARVLDTDATITAGAPSVDAGAETVQPGDADTGGDVAAGAPRVSADAEVVPAGDTGTTATVGAGAPVLTARAEKVGVAPPSDAGGDVAAGAPEVDATARVVPVPSETNVQIAWLGAGAWMPRTNPTRAVMPLVVRCQGGTEDLCPAICRELDKKLDWAIFSETAIPFDAAPHGTITGASGQHVIGGVVVSLDVNQSLPDFEDGSPEPSISEVRILLTQPTSSDSDDLPLFIARRADLRRVLSRLTGGIGV